MESLPSRRVLETLLSRKPREYSLEVGALSVLTILGISLLAWQNGAALLPTLAATSEGALEEHECELNLKREEGLAYDFAQR